MPLVSQTFDQLLDFTRTSAATFVGSNGLIQTTPASVNLLLWTQQFDNAAWTKNGTTVTANSTVAPDGTSTADTLVETSGGTFHWIDFSNASLVASSTTVTASVYLKANGRNWALINLGTGQSAYFDLINGVVGTTAGTLLNTAITSAGNGWYRCSITAVTATSTGRIQVYAASANGTPSYAGDGTSGIYVWGAQLEAASAATTYTRNNGGVFPPRFEYDPVTLAAKGLLIEEQRTNLQTYSEDFTNAIWNKFGTTVTANATVSPDGAADADALVEDAATSTHFCQQFFSGFTSGTAYTFSAYVKPSTRTWTQLLLPSAAFGVGQGSFFDLTGNGALGNVVGSPSSRTIAAVGNGWYRVTVTATATATAGGNCVIYAASANGTASYAGNSSTALSLYGAQLEAGAFATSYIPTVASQVTRTADVCSIVAPNFSPWYNQSEGTFVVEFDVLVSANAVAAHALAATTASTQNNINRIWMWNGTPGLMRNTVNSGAANSAELTGATIVANTVLKAASAYRVNDYAFVTNGGAVATDTSGATPVGLTLLAIGQRGDNVEQLNGHIRSIRYYPTRLTNAQLQALTA